MMAAVMGISNDGRGWIMTALSGVACVFGASFIYVDIIVRQFPGKRNFRIRDSDTFLSLSLSLSFGVMIFSALYSMLPSAKSSLIKGDYSSKEAAWILVACFIGGIVGIQIISYALDHIIPHHVVSCEHTHEDEEAYKEGTGSHEHVHDRQHSHGDADERQAWPETRLNTKSKGRASTQPSRQQMQKRALSNLSSKTHDSHAGAGSQAQRELQASSGGRPTLRAKLSKTFVKIASGQDLSCECDTPCHGYKDPCQSACFKNIDAKGSFKAPKPTKGINRPSAIKNATATESTPLLQGVEEEPVLRPQTRAATEHVDAHPSDSEHDHRASDYSSETIVDETDGQTNLHKTASHGTGQPSDREQSEADPRHHHHVPQNAFASIGFQTCIAIALHKLPEGFITYATNHANPKLGVAVFISLFIHNITEGFVMALPIYLAINNRIWALCTTFVLGGLSQPAGAGVAAIWFKVAGKRWTPSDAGYGGMFAVTAGIMTSVALQLYVQAAAKAHSKGLCVIAACTGMFILAASSALTA